MYFTFIYIYFLKNSRFLPNVLGQFSCSHWSTFDVCPKLILQNCYLEFYTTSNDILLPSCVFLLVCVM